jgi:hypothetical protein
MKRLMVEGWRFEEGQWLKVVFMAAGSRLNETKHICLENPPIQKVLFLLRCHL